MKQTAVEWLANELYEKFEMKGDGVLFNDLLNQANKIFTEQIEDAFDSGWKRADTTRDIPYSTAEDFGNNYYNQTFNTKPTTTNNPEDFLSNESKARIINTITENGEYTKSTPWYDEEQTVARINVIGQNGNDGIHYDE